MNILLTPELDQFVNEQVEQGKYQDALSVISAGLRLLSERERIYKGRFAELKRDVMIGIEQLERGEVIDGEAVFD
ncbi:MAG: type II toxin-antitoxin system ParD family antitoxin [Hormoscilla sp. GM102CHS1]|nr:type II toxin-antitoxin system ParD family antitoxin [Hormoscilla sp. GM102CHS1]